MENSEEKKSWGGRRTGAGRKKTRGKSYYFASTPTVEAIIEARAQEPGFSRTDFINAAIEAYVAARR